MAISATRRRLGPTFSHVAVQPPEPDLLFHTLLSISPPVQRAMKSPVELSKLTEFINAALFYTEHKAVKHVGDLASPKGAEPTDVLTGIEAVECCAVNLGPSVKVTMFAVSRWPDYYVCWVRDELCIVIDRLHLLRVVS